MCKKKNWIILLAIFLIVGCSVKNNENKKINREKENINMSNISVLINNKKYNVILEKNRTAQEFVNLLPNDFMMQELNGNEKYVYLDTKLSSDAIDIKHIIKGDIMLYGNNCIVIFYKSFETNYRYTKIGHIENLNHLDSNDVLVKFSL